jgi:hypothetical protein
LQAAFSVSNVALVATQLCSKHISAAVNQHATIDKTVFFVGPPYNEDLMQLELELSRVPELAVATEN